MAKEYRYYSDYLCDLAGIFLQKLMQEKAACLKRTCSIFQMVRMTKRLNLTQLRSITELMLAQHIILQRFQMVASIRQALTYLD